MGSGRSETGRVRRVKSPWCPLSPRDTTRDTALMLMRGAHTVYNKEREGLTHNAGDSQRESARSAINNERYELNESRFACGHYNVNIRRGFGPVPCQLFAGIDVSCADRESQRARQVMPFPSRSFQSVHPEMLDKG